MTQIGDRAHLTIVREEDHGIYVETGSELGEVLLPRREMPKRWQMGDKLDVFLYTDSEDRPVATLKQPKVAPGEFGYLEVVQVTPVGAFLDWGLPKDLLLPFGETRERLEVGRSYVVHVHVDPDTDRLVASRRLARHLSKDKPRYEEGQEVDLILFGKTDLGYKAIINGQHQGLLYAEQVFRRLRAGEKTKGYISKVREDSKIDLSLYPPGPERFDELEERILAELGHRGGAWHLCDTSPAEEIYEALGVS